MLSFNKFLLALHNHFIKPIKLNIEPVTLLAGATALGGWLGYEGTQSAAETSAAGTQAGIDENRRQFNVAQELQQPFLQAATGTRLPAGISPQLAEIIAKDRSGGQLTQLEQLEMQMIGPLLQTGQITQNDLNLAVEHVTNPQEGALQQLQAGIDQAPTTPTLDRFQGQAVAPTDVQRFQCQAVQAPGLESFNFDPNQALNDPSLQFQQKMGMQAVERAAGKNRQLGSGARLMAAQEFGQGLASQSLQDEYNRQLQSSQARNQAATGQFGLSSQTLGQEQTINQLANQQNIQQQNLGRQFLSDEQALNALSNQQTTSQYGLEQDAYNARLNRLSGLVDVGAGAGSSMGANAMTSGANTAAMIQSGANTQAAAQLGQSNIIGGTIQQLGGLAGQAYQPGSVTTNYNPVNTPYMPAVY